MATTVDARVIAATLYDALVSTTLAQLRAAAPKLAGAKGGDLSARVEAALPGDVLPQVRNFLLSLAKEGLLDQVDEIATAFANYAASSAAQTLDANVTSAINLSPDQQAAIIADLRKRYGEVAVSFAVDASLIGGLIVRVGDQVLDNSLRTRLSAIQRNMLAS